MNLFLLLKLRLACVSFFLLVTSLAWAGLRPAAVGGLSLRDETLRAFQTYVATTEQTNDQSVKSAHFLWIDEPESADKSSAYAKLKGGEVLLRHITRSDGNSDIAGGLIHDWEGLVFIPGARLRDTVEFLQDYDHQSTYFAPDVERSKILEHHGDHYRVFLRFKRNQIVTVVLNTEHDVTYYPDSPTRAHSRSSATRIAEVDNPGETSEKERAPGKDNGFLWRMETWWRMEEKDGGVYVQNQVVSLTRDVPIGLGWVVEPFINGIPSESLEFTLSAVRRGVLSRSKAAR